MGVHLAVIRCSGPSQSSAKAFFRRLLFWPPPHPLRPKRNRGRSSTSAAADSGLQNFAQDEATRGFASLGRANCFRSARFAGTPSPPWLLRLPMVVICRRYV